MNEQDFNQGLQSEEPEETVVQPGEEPEETVVQLSEEPVYVEQRPHTVSPDSPYSPLYNPYKDKKKKGNTLTIILLSLLGLIIIIALVVAVSNVVESAMSEIKSSSSERRKERTVDLLDELEEAMEKNKDDDQNSIGDVYKGEFEDNEKAQEDENEYRDFEEYEYGNSDDDVYVPRPTDEYYVEIVDAIDDTLSYKMQDTEYTYEDEDQNVYIYIVYPQIVEGDVKNKEYLNEYIEERANYYMKNFASHPERGEVSDCEITVLGYVTYMDEETLSIVLYENYYLGDYIGNMDICAINIDLTTGQILDKNSMLNYTEELGKEFRENSDYQNGSVPGVEMLTNEEIADYLADEDSGFLFFTPVGLELGYNYVYEEEAYVITATFKEYSKYIKKL